MSWVQAVLARNDLQKKMGSCIVQKSEGVTDGKCGDEYGDNKVTKQPIPIKDCQ